MTARATSIKVKEIQKIIRTLPKPKTVAAKSAMKELRKAVANYIKYEGDPEKVPARKKLADIIVKGIKAKL